MSLEMLEASRNFVEQSSKNSTDNKDGPIDLRNLDEPSYLNVGAEKRPIDAAARTKTGTRTNGSRLEQDSTLSIISNSRTEPAASKSGQPRQKNTMKTDKNRVR